MVKKIRFSNFDICFHYNEICIELLISFRGLIFFSSFHLFLSVELPFFLPLRIKEHNALSNSQVLKLIVDRFVRQGRDWTDLKDWWWTEHRIFVRILSDKFFFVIQKNNALSWCSYSMKLRNLIILPFNYIHFLIIIVLITDHFILVTCSYNAFNEVSFYYHISILLFLFEWIKIIKIDSFRWKFSTIVP